MMNYQAIVNAATDYNIAMYNLRKNFPAGVYLGSWTKLHDRDAELYTLFDRAEKILWAVCECTNIPVEVAIMAARLENRYYERGGYQILDVENLIKSLM